VVAGAVVVVGGSVVVGAAVEDVTSGSVEAVKSDLGRTAATRCVLSLFASGAVTIPSAMKPATI
jgi:hypothetical protein